jgi:tetratricopeptide (TPR) repeat protein
MRVVHFVVLASFFSTPSLFGQEPDKKKLQQTVRIPRIGASAGFGIDGERGLLVPTDVSQRDPSAEIAEWQKKLKGNADDAYVYGVLGRLYAAKGDEEEGKKATKKSIELYRQSVRSNPADGRALYGLANALADARETKEAESVRRKAVEVAPDDWRNWNALGDLLLGRALCEILGGQDAADEKLTNQVGALRAALVKLAADQKIKKDDAVSARKLLKQSRECMDRAVKASPEESMTYAHRAIAGVFQNDLDVVIGCILEERLNPYADIFPEESVRDFQEAAKRSPNDYQRQFSAIIFEWYYTCWKLAEKGGRGDPQRKMWECLPEANRKSLERGLERLEALTHAADKKNAAGAAEAFAVLVLLLEPDEDKALAYFQRACDLDPSREKAWDFLLSLSATVGNEKERLKYCEKGIAAKDCPRRRLQVAGVQENLARYDEAEKQVAAALKADPKDFHANLALAALLIRKADSPVRLAVAGKQVERANSLFPLKAEAADKNDLEATRGVYLAVTGDLENARTLLQKILAEDQNHPVAKDALKALEK